MKLFFATGCNSYVLPQEISVSKELQGVTLVYFCILEHGVNLFTGRADQNS